VVSRDGCEHGSGVSDRSSPIERERTDSLSPQGDRAESLVESSVGIDASEERDGDREL
jgi:hypothetical protein